MTQFAIFGLLATGVVFGQPPASVLARVDAHAEHFGSVSRRIWETPELGFREVKSAALLRDELRAAGFRVRENAGGMPTAFVAEWGSGAPVIAILGEYDALPGLSQDAVPERKVLLRDGPGHGCGHNLLGAASALAAVAVKEQIEARGLRGTIRYYGSPAEEGGGGKIYLLRTGEFKDVDVVLAWHHTSFSAADASTWLANVSSRIRFHGKAAHAAAAPEAGRSALDGVEVMTHAINLMREHVPQETRMHYIITRGGAAANIVPDVAEVSLIVRNPDLNTLQSLWERVKKCAQAGALATETTVEIEITLAYANVISVPSLVRLLDENLHQVGGIHYTPEERVFAQKMRTTLEAKHSLEDVERVQPPVQSGSYASSDVGDVSWNVPTGHVLVATFPPDVPLHSWQSTACAGTSIGRKGMVAAAKTLALTATRLFEDPRAVAEAKAGWAEVMRGRSYQSLLPADHKPAIE
jgi:aminobenzoyl-glutamate utilization protein B